MGVLVLVTLYGGNDGLNTVVPYSKNSYYDARPDIAYRADEVVQLDDEYGLNPGMTGFGQMFAKNQLAIVRGVGYPDQDRSHFRSMDIWQSASIDNEVTSGWVGRWLDRDKRTPLDAVNVGSVLPLLAVGSRITAATLSPENVTRTSEYIGIMSNLAEPDPNDDALSKTVRNSYRTAADATRRFKQIFEDGVENSSESRKVSDKSLSTQLAAVGSCIKAGLPTRVYCVSLSGFDTHANEKSAQQNLLRSVDESVTKFVADMSQHDRGQNVVVMAYSEFGRRVAANASDGTDHGTSGPVFIAGAPVKGGFYGDDPSLTDLTQGDLKTTTDFRDVYAELLSKTLGTDPDPIVGAKRKPLGFLA